MSLDLKPAILKALLEDANVIAYVDEWETGHAISTRRPVPKSFPPRCMVINDPAAIGDFDGLNSDRPIVVQDIAIYGNQPADYREVEALGFHVRTMFHRQKWSIQPEGFKVVDIVASGPIVGPVDDERTVARIVTITVKLRRSP